MEKFLEAKISGYYDARAPAAFPDDEASTASGKKREFFIVGERKIFLGMVSEAALLAASPTEKLRNLMFKPPALQDSATVLEALKLFASSKMQQLPVITKDGKLAGALSIYSLLPRMDFSQIPLEKVMNHNPFTAAETAPVADLRELMARNRVSRIYVKDSSGRLAGVITPGSFLQKPVFYKKDWRRASEIMERSVVGILPTDDSARAAAQLARHSVRTVAVVSKDGKLEGSVTIFSLIARYLESAEPAGQGIAVEVSGLGSLENFERSAVNSAIYEQIRKIALSLGPAKVKLVFKSGKSTWECKVSAEPARGRMMLLTAEGYDLFTCAAQALRTLEKRVRHG